jgi:hypothetical protein
MVMPPLLNLADEAAFRAHFEVTCCRASIFTHDGIRVFFRKEDFEHAFFESSGRRGEKDVFSITRAERMDWIAEALSDPAAICYQGWNKQRRCYDPTRRVTVVFNDFVIVIALRLKRDGAIKASFVTCYQADNSIAKIQRSPQWTLQDFNNVAR